MNSTLQNPAVLLILVAAGLAVPLFVATFYFLFRFAGSAVASASGWSSLAHDFAVSNESLPPHSHWVAGRATIDNVRFHTLQLCFHSDHLLLRVPSLFGPGLPPLAIPFTELRPGSRDAFTFPIRIFPPRSSVVVVRGITIELLGALSERFDSHTT